MALELQLAHCEKCSGYCSSTVLNQRDLENPEIIDHYFYHGEPWFTLDKDTFRKSINQKKAQIRIVDFDLHLKDDKRYCSCAKNTNGKSGLNSYKIPTIQNLLKAVDEYTAEDVYFYDLYITAHNYYQDLQARKAM